MGRGMYNLERQEQIIAVLEKRKSISVKELAQLLYVSQPTVRRDLESLQQQGKLQRTHGGVVLRKRMRFEKYRDTGLNPEDLRRQK